MRLSRRVLFTVAALLVTLFFTPSAQAVLKNRVFVSQRSGNNANSCDNILTPCQTFAGAVVQLNPGGEAIVLDSGGYGPVTITQSLTIEAPPGVLAFIHPPSGNAITVDAPGATVVLRGLTIEGASGDGIRGQAFSVLHIENCVISGSTMNGIFVSSSGQLFVLDTIARGNASGNGLYILNVTTNLTALVERCRFENNVFSGVAVVGNCQVTVRDTVAAGNGSGFADNGSAGTSDLTLENCVASNNTNWGIWTQSAGATVRVSNCTVAGNASFGLDNDGAGTILYSRQNNTVAGNNGGGAQTNGTITPLGPI